MNANCLIKLEVINIRMLKANGHMFHVYVMSLKLALNDHSNF